MMKISSKIIGINFGNSILDNYKWDKISDSIAKQNPYLEQSQTLFDRDNRKPNSLIQTMVHMPNLYYSKLYQKRYIRFHLKQEKNMTFQTPSSTFHFDEWTRYFRYRDIIKLSENKMISKVIKSH